MARSKGSRPDWFEGEKVKPKGKGKGSGKGKSKGKGKGEEQEEDERHDDGHFTIMTLNLDSTVTATNAFYNMRCLPATIVCYQEMSKELVDKVPL